MTSGNLKFVSQCIGEHCKGLLCKLLINGGFGMWKFFILCWCPKIIVAHNPLKAHWREKLRYLFCCFYWKRTLAREDKRNMLFRIMQFTSQLFLCHFVVMKKLFNSKSTFNVNFGLLSWHFPTPLNQF